MRLRIVSYWFRKLFNLVGVRAKIMGIAVTLVALLASLLIWQAESTFTTVLREEVEKRGVSLGQYLAVRSENVLLTNNVYALHELIRDTMNNNPELVYLLIIDSEGRLVLDSFTGQGIPNGLLDFNGITGQKDHSHKILQTDSGLVQDIAVPIMDGAIGQVRLGISEVGIVSAVKDLRRLLLVSTLIISLLGVALAYFLASLINRPLRELVKAIQTIGSGQLDYRVPLDWAKDELGQLGTAFNKMSSELQQGEAERQGLWEEVRRKEEMRRYLLDKVITAQEEERLRISRELHDETGQALISVNLALSSLEGIQEADEFHRRVELMQATVTKALEDIHLLARQLRPSVLDKLGLTAAVERFIQECTARWGKEIGLTFAGCESEDLSSEVKIAAYRIIQEALSNALRHSKAENLSVVLQEEKEKVLIIVEDDGTGFNLGDVENRTTNGKHLGLFGMQERAEMLGGKLTVETSLGCGTTIYVELPVKGGVSGAEATSSSAANR